MLKYRAEKEGDKKLICYIHKKIVLHCTEIRGFVSSIQFLK